MAMTTLAFCTCETSSLAVLAMLLLYTSGAAHTSSFIASIVRRHRSSQFSSKSCVVDASYAVQKS